MWVFAFPSIASSWQSSCKELATARAMLGSWDGAELRTFLPSSPLCLCWSLPLSGQRYCCKNLLMAVNVRWRSWFAARVGHCVLSRLLVLGWDVPWSPPASRPPSRLGARTAQPARPWHPLWPEHGHLPAPSKPPICHDVLTKRHGNYWDGVGYVPRGQNRIQGINGPRLPWKILWSAAVPSPPSQAGALLLFGQGVTPGIVPVAPLPTVPPGAALHATVG